jgi:hypothetical protein
VRVTSSLSLPNQPSSLRTPVRYSTSAPSFDHTFTFPLLGFGQVLAVEVVEAVTDKPRGLVVVAAQSLLLDKHNRTAAKLSASLASGVSEIVNTLRNVPSPPPPPSQTTDYLRLPSSLPSVSSLLSTSSLPYYTPSLLASGTVTYTPSLTLCPFSSTFPPSLGMAAVTDDFDVALTKLHLARLKNALTHYNHFKAG